VSGAAEEVHQQVGEVLVEEGERMDLRENVE
jgi:hypothetical protein